MNIKTFSRKPKKTYKKNALNVNSEAYQQQLVVLFIRSTYPNALYCASAGGMRTSYLQAVKMKRTGYVKGFPDLFIYEPRGEFHGLAIEMKKEKGGSVSSEQKWWRDELRNRNYDSYICKGSEEAIEIIKKYLDT
jgi:VRR-NUC domain